MVAPKQRFQALRTTLAYVLFFAALIPVGAYSVVAFVLVLPYSFYHFSSNYGMREKDMPVVQSETKYACKPLVVGSVTDHTYSLAAGLFIALEDLRFPLRMLWEFLKEEVESHHSVNETEKAEFQRVMD
ncbi:MAG: hypothetical protein Q9207_005508 [Kuettlingeria erythrocarpa]